MDRFDSNIAENAAYMLDALIGDDDTPNPFFGADALWSGFQQKLNDFVNDSNNGTGLATALPYITNRANWVVAIAFWNKP